MSHFVGLDVSQKMTAICIVVNDGRRIWRGQCPSVPEHCYRQVPDPDFGSFGPWQRITAPVRFGRAATRIVNDVKGVNRVRPRRGEQAAGYDQVGVTGRVP